MSFKQFPIIIMAKQGKCYKYASVQLLCRENVEVDGWI